MLYFSMFYGLFTIVGGVIGFIKAGSVISLAAGVISGLAIITSTLAYIRGQMIGFILLIGISLMLGGWFLNGYLATEKFMPQMLMVILSTLNLVGLLLLKRPSQHTALR